MNIDLFQEKYLDLLIINNKNLIYFKITQEKTKIKIWQSEKIETEIYSRGVFNLVNLESAIQTLLTKHKLTELGIVLNTPNIIFQRINLPRGTSNKEAIINYLKTNFPLAIEKYALFYKEDRYRALPSLATFSIFLLAKEIIDALLSIIQKYGLVPLFISPTTEIFYQYLLHKSFLDFNEDYLIFLLVEGNLSTFLIKNLRLEKVILEEYSAEKINLELTINRIYGFLKPELKPTTKILFFLEEKFNVDFIEQQKVFLSATINTLLEGSYYVYLNVLTDKQVVDFVPLKNYTVYFLNRLPAALTFLSIYILPLIFATSIAFVILQNKLNKEINFLAQQTKTLPSIEYQGDLEKLVQITSLIKPDVLKKFSILNQISTLPVSRIEFNQQTVIFSLQTTPNEQEKIKYQVNLMLPQARLIEEIIEENVVKLKYNF